MFDAVRRFITWDMPRIEKWPGPMPTNILPPPLISRGTDGIKIDSTRCPQNYGYNGIKLTVPKAGTKVKLEFKGIAGTDGYNKVKTDKAGWRYGFVAYKKRWQPRIWGKLTKTPVVIPPSKFRRIPNTLWLVVSRSAHRALAAYPWAVRTTATIPMHPNSVPKNSGLIRSN